MYSPFPETGGSVLLSGKTGETDQNMMNISCQSAGWYPKPDLQWYEQEKAVTPKSLEYSTDSSGLESVHSWLLVPSTFDISCSVGLAGEEPKKGRLRLDNPPAPGKDKYCCVCNPFIVFVLIHTEVMLSLLCRAHTLNWVDCLLCTPHHPRICSSSNRSAVLEKEE